MMIWLPPIGENEKGFSILGGMFGLSQIDNALPHTVGRQRVARQIVEKIDSVMGPSA